MNANQHLARYYARRDKPRGLPVLVRTALPYAVLSALSALTIAADEVVWRPALAISVAIVIAGLVRVCIVASEDRAARAEADAWLRAVTDGASEPAAERPADERRSAVLNVLEPMDYR